MKKYLITVNGNQYEVEVEEMPAKSEVGLKRVNEQPEIRMPAPKTETHSAAPAVKEVKSAPTPPQTPVKAKKGSETVTSPMPGTILKIAVTEGQEVKKGQLLCILEAMKMENEIVSSRDAKIAAIMTIKGASVNAGDPLVSFE